MGLPPGLNIEIGLVYQKTLKKNLFISYLTLTKIQFDTNCISEYFFYWIKIGMSQQNLAFYFQDFTSSLDFGSINYTTAGVIPSNTIDNRVFVFTVSGTFDCLPQDENVYTLILDFTNVRTERQITLEGPVDGNLNVCSKTYNASSLVSYKLVNRVLTLQIVVPVRLKKKKHFSINAQINDCGYLNCTPLDPNTSQYCGPNSTNPSCCPSAVSYDSSYSLVYVSGATLSTSLHFSVNSSNQINQYSSSTLCTKPDFVFGPYISGNGTISNNTLNLTYSFNEYTTPVDFTINMLGNFSQLYYQIGPSGCSNSKPVPITINYTYQNEPQSLQIPSTSCLCECVSLIPNSNQSLAKS